MNNRSALLHYLSNKTGKHGIFMKGLNIVSEKCSSEQHRKHTPVHRDNLTVSQISANNTEV